MWVYLSILAPQGGWDESTNRGQAARRRKRTEKGDTPFSLAAARHPAPAPGIISIIGVPFLQKDLSWSPACCSPPPPHTPSSKRKGSLTPIAQRTQNQARRCFKSHQIHCFLIQTQAASGDKHISSLPTAGRGGPPRPALWSKASALRSSWPYKP